MCYSVSSSFGTFFFVAIICCILWMRGSKLQKTLAIMLGFIALMQVIEGLLWLNLDCNDINVFISSFIPVLLFLQPIVVIGALWWFDTGLLPSLYYKILLGIAVLSLPLYIDWFKSGFGKCTVVGPKGHLAWPFTNVDSLASTLYNIIIAIGFGTLSTPWYGIFYLIMATIAKYKSKMTYGHSWGSVWCHFVNLLAVGALFV